MEVVLPAEVKAVVVMGVVVLEDVQIRPDEPLNIPYLSAVEVLHAPQSVRAKDDAPANIFFMLVTLDTSHLEISLLNDDAELNMYAMLVTLDTSHFERSPLNDFAAWKMARMSVTLDTSQEEIGPCGPLEQSEDSCRHSLMALWSSSFDFGAHPAVQYHNISVKRLGLGIGLQYWLEPRCASV